MAAKMKCVDLIPFWKKITFQTFPEGLGYFEDVLKKDPSRPKDIPRRTPRWPQIISNSPQYVPRSA